MRRASSACEWDTAGLQWRLDAGDLQAATRRCLRMCLNTFWRPSPALSLPSLRMHKISQRHIMRMASTLCGAETFQLTGHQQGQPGHHRQEFTHQALWFLLKKV